ncbi:BRCA1-associated protein-like [Oopsacas minuta]|uniref:BRCA1-associated protein-like n=1 Tax=Oopsacas minuta TaxID=111878 RepID=A0AAV7JFF8_9METZ|nr:BRCA1-associated protein-like [Oopsacas minuta]
MAIVPIDITNSKDSKEPKFILVIEIDNIDCKQDIPFSLLDFYSPGPKTVKSSSNWFDQRGKRSVSDILVDCYSEEDMAKSSKNCSKDKTKPNDNSMGKIEKLHFFSGNSGTEKVRGVIHFFRETSHLKSKEQECITSPETPKTISHTSLVCLLAIPVSISCTQIVSFLASVRHVLKKIWIVRNSTPNQYIAVLDFESALEASKFREGFKNRAYTSLDPAVCHIVALSKIDIVKASEDAYPPNGKITELPVCTVCLEKLDETCNGILTVLCNHSFHAQCLVKWEDTSCPICRCSQIPEGSEDNECKECLAREDLWLCILCGFVGCGRYLSGHAVDHFMNTGHTYSMHLGTQRVWDYVGDNYVHRLIMNKDDGKLVEIGRSFGLGDEEKMESLALEYTFLLTQQLDSQRKYFEERMSDLTTETQNQIKETSERSAQLSTECQFLMQKLETIEKEKKSLDKKYSQLVTKSQRIEKDLKEERQLNSCLQENQEPWQHQIHELQEKLAKTITAKDNEIHELRDQVRDVMFSLEMKQKLEKSEFKDEVKDGYLLVQEKEAGASVTGQTASGKKHRKRK